MSQLCHNNSQSSAHHHFSFNIWEESYHTYWTAEHTGDSKIEAIQVKDIQSTVMMAPDKQYGKTIQDGTENNRWYLMERPGLRLTELSQIPKEFDNDN